MDLKKKERKITEGTLCSKSGVSCFEAIIADSSFEVRGPSTENAVVVSSIAKPRKATRAKEKTEQEDS